MDSADGLRRNVILRQLPEPELRRLASRVEIIHAETRQEVSRPGEPISAVYFPLRSVYSLVGVADDRVLVEVATIGHEGMVGLPLFLGAVSSPHASFCQVPGASACLSAHDLRAVLADGATLHRALNRLTQATMVQIAQNVVCNNTHDTERRAARWLLTTHDRVGEDRFPMTQQFLAQMLGVRRPTVSDIARRLQSDGLIEYRRGIMTIADRSRLERTACKCYAIVRGEFDAMIRG